MTRLPARCARGALAGVFFLLYGLVALPFGALVYLPVVPRRAARWAIRVFYRLFVFCARLTGLFRVDCSAADRAALRALKGRVVAMNHVSLVDIVVLLAHLGDSVCIAKASARRNPFLSAVVSKVFIANDKGASRTLAEVRGHLASGVNVVVFPEGTRVRPDEPSRFFSRGAARFALVAQAPIAVCKIVYDPPVLGKNQPWWDVGDRRIMVKLHYRGELAAEGQSNYRNAVATTARIKEMMT